MFQMPVVDLSEIFVSWYVLRLGTMSRSDTELISIQ